jgi:hypothetical protein
MRAREADGTGSIAICLLVFVSVAALGALSGYWLMQPRVIPNPGLAAYKPPPGTRLIPPPRKMDAPELVELPALLADVPAAKLEPPQKTTPKATVVNPKAVARRSKPKAQPVDDVRSAFAYSGPWRYSERRSYANQLDRGWSSWGGGWNMHW